jgi:hypothetical protein
MRNDSNCGKELIEQVCNDQRKSSRWFYRERVRDDTIESTPDESRKRIYMLLLKKVSDVPVLKLSEATFRHLTNPVSCKYG